MADYVEGRKYHLRPTGGNWVHPEAFEGVYEFTGDGFVGDKGIYTHPASHGYEYEVSEIDPENDAINPDHYQFPGGAQVIDISEHLTANAAQALQYIARSSRIDGKNKGDATEDISKAIWFLEREKERISGD